MRARRRGVEISLHSKRFRASSSRKMGREQKKGMRGRGKGAKETAFPLLPFPPPPPPRPLLFFFFFVLPL